MNKTKLGSTIPNSNRATKISLNTTNQGQERGGVSIVFRKDLDVAQLEAEVTPTMQYSIWKYIKKNKPVHIIGMYHLQPNAENATPNAMFLDDLTELLMDKLTKLENIRLLGDFNMHIEEITSLDTIIFNDTMEALDLTQNITQPIHNKGNILDLVFTEPDSNITITGCRTSTPILDHYSTIIDANIKKNKPNIVTKNQGHNKTITNTHNGSIHTTHI